MKFLRCLLLILVLFPQVILAETITTGDSYINTSISTNANDGSVHSTFETNIQSSGESRVTVESKTESSYTSENSTYKKIKVTVNGEKKIVESSESGTIKIEMKADKKHSPTPTPKPHKNEMENGIESWVKNFIKTILSF